MHLAICVLERFHKLGYSAIISERDFRYSKFKGSKFITGARGVKFISRNTIWFRLKLATVLKIRAQASTLSFPVGLCCNSPESPFCIERKTVMREISSISLHACIKNGAPSAVADKNKKNVEIIDF